MLTGLVGRATWVRPLVLDGVFVHPVQELSNVLPRQPLDGHTVAPFLSFPDGRLVFGRSASRWVSRTEVVGHRRLKSGWHRQAPAPPVLASMPDPPIRWRTTLLAGCRL